MNMQQQTMVKNHSPQQAAAFHQRKKTPSAFAPRRMLVVLLAAGACCLAMAGQCASLSVYPIGFELRPEQPSSVLKISNAGSETVRLQVSGFDWRNDMGKEILTENDSLVINPPIFSIAPGAAQFVRFGARRASALEEQSFRLLIDEVPSGTVSEGGLRTVLRISIPVFIAPQTARHNVTWQVLKTDGGYVLAAQNDGNLHKKIVRLQVSAADNAAGIHIKTPIYLLAGQRAQWPIPVERAQAGDTAVRLSIHADKVDSEEQFTLVLP